MNYSIFMENIVISNLQLFTQIHKIKVYNQINIFMVGSISIILFGDTRDAEKRKKIELQDDVEDVGPHL